MASQTPEVAYEVPPFVVVYKDGTVERLIGDEIVPTSQDSQTEVQSKDVVVEPETGVSARLYMPNTTNRNSKIPLLVFFHGGGFLVESPFSPRYHKFLNSLVAEANVVAVSVHYRRAPEHPVPIAYEDSWAALKWVASHSNGGSGAEPWIKDYIDFERVYLAGDSSGANIAHNMAIRLGSENLDGIKIGGIVLLHPYFWGEKPIDAEAGAADGNREETIDFSCIQEALRPSAGARAMINKWWNVACPSISVLDDPLINPLIDPRLSSLGCKRVLVILAENDVFKHRGLQYYEELKKNEWEGMAEVLESEGEGHVFFLDNPNSEKTIDLLSRVVSFVHQE